jgi:hypothetical protein
MGSRLPLRPRGLRRRRRVHLRRGDGDLQLDRGLSRRAAQQAAVPRRRRVCSASRHWSTTSRRSPTCCRSCSGVARRSPPPARPARRAPSCSACRARSRRPGVYELPFGDDTAPGDRCSPAACRRATQLRAVLLGGAAGSFATPTTSTCRSRSRTSARQRAHARQRCRDGARRARRPRRVRAPDRRVLPRRELRAVRAVPCRDTSVRRRCSAARAPRARSSSATVALFADIGRVLRDASICGFGHSAHGAVESAIAKLGVFS